MTTVDILAARRAAFWRAQSQRYEPRNAAAIKAARSSGQIEEGGHIVASFVDRTPLRHPHVFVDSGREYDWRFASLLRAWVAVKPGVDAGKVLRDLYDMTGGYLGLIDVERQLVADVVPSARGLKLHPYLRGSEPWEAVFG